MEAVMDYLAQFDTELWQRWRPIRFSPIRWDYHIPGQGADVEPDSSLWMAYLAEAIGDRFREGMTLLDYGCGVARFANFMSGRLKEFTYYGLEPRAACCGLGINGVVAARPSMDHDKRVHLGYIGEEIEQEAIGEADVGLLGSVFPHLLIEDSHAILDKLQPVVKRGGILVFTAILGESYQASGPGVHGLPDCYALVTNTPEQFNGRGAVVGTYRTLYGIDQTLYRIEAWNE